MGSLPRNSDDRAGESGDFFTPNRHLRSSASSAGTSPKYRNLVSLCKNILFIRTYIDILRLVNTRINDLPDELRPREKMARQGSGALSDAELLAIFLRVGIKGESAIEIGRRLLATHGGLGALGQLDIAQLAAERGLGLAKAAQLAAAVELGARVARERASRIPLDSPDAVYDTFAPQMRHLRCESLRVALLDTRLRATRFVTISDGSVNETIAHPRDILHPAVLHRAYGFLLVHNHPSGDPSPSRADRELTRRVADAAALLQVNLLDHLIIGCRSDLHDPYFSFQEAGLL